MPFDGVGNRTRQDIRWRVFNRCSVGVWQQGGTAIAVKIALDGGGSSGELTAGCGIRRRWWTTKIFFNAVVGGEGDCGSNVQ
jgi:hypothetical protein